MIKNYIFDLGNVVLILEWDKVLNKYNITNEEKELLRKHVFNSKEWELLDEGVISKEEAIKMKSILILYFYQNFQISFLNLITKSVVEIFKTLCQCQKSIQKKFEKLL